MRAPTSCALVAALLLAGCVGSRSGVILLPGAEGHATGKLAVLDENGDDQAVLDQGDSRVKLKHHVSQRRVKPAQPTLAEQRVLADLPEKEARFVLYFALGKPDIEPRSAGTMRAMLAEVERRGRGVDVEIVGYTDAVGSPERNQLLSEQRAEAVLERLVADRLIRRDYTHASGRGELDPIAPNAPDGSQPDNRRVEVIVR
jgi:outer membrane protein OmpA-like peptidoglycan-associated protein